jgi:tetratricopeptide (TPR) repeat protein
MNQILSLIDEHIMRLADPKHPASKHLQQVVNIIDKYVHVEMAGERTATKISAPRGEMEKAISIIDEAISLYKDDVDLLIAKANILNASAQFESSEKMLDEVLGKVPDHFEAKMWKNHRETWSNAIRFPHWKEQSSILHPVMEFHLKCDHRVQIVRDGIQKTVAIVTLVQGPPFDKNTQIKVEWILSKTPYGPLVAYYLRIIEPTAEPSTMEAFLSIFRPSLFTPMEGLFLVQQLAFTPYCFVVLVGEKNIMLNRKIIFSQMTIDKIREIASQLNTDQSYLPQDQFKNAMQWHMNNFDMNKLKFD